MNNDLEELHPNNGSLSTTPDPIFDFEVKKADYPDT